MYKQSTGTGAQQNMRVVSCNRTVHTSCYVCVVVLLGVLVLYSSTVGVGAGGWPLAESPHCRAATAAF
jgi:hypothetical protein